MSEDEEWPKTLEYCRVFGSDINRHFRKGHTYVISIMSQLSQFNFMFKRKQGWGEEGGWCSHSRLGGDQGWLWWWQQWCCQGAGRGYSGLCVYIEQDLEICAISGHQAQAPQDNAALHWSPGSCWPADNFIFIIVSGKFFWFSIIARQIQFIWAQCCLSFHLSIFHKKRWLFSNPLAMRRALQMIVKGVSYLYLCIKIFSS